MLIIGAGLSSGLVPTPYDLFQENRELAQIELGCNPRTDDLPSSAEALYEWAERILALLEGTAGAPPKLRLANSLGLLSETCWTATVGVDLRGTMPRHRVIARFAREDRWASVWSLNWDCLLENALECVGLDRGEGEKTQPWLTKYSTVVTRADFGKLSQRYLFAVLKPHGCVRALVEAQEAFDMGDCVRAGELAGRFMICTSELSNERSSDTDVMFFVQMRADLQKAPLLITGWSVSEPYLISVVDDALSRRVRRGIPEELSIVDPFFNAHGHVQITSCYGLTQADVHFAISADIDIDAFFLWLQATYCLDQLAEAASEDVKHEIRIRSNLLAPRVDHHFLYDWADNFLPAWTRLCWRAEVVRCAGYNAHELALDRPDEHIPWSLRPLPRPDLEAAANLLASIPADGGRWDVKLYPGALWDEEHLRLVIPLPIWDELNDLRALKWLSRDQPFGFIEKLELLPLHFDLNAPAPTAAELDNLRAKLARAMNVAGFAKTDEIALNEDILEIR